MLIKKFKQNNRISTNDELNNDENINTLYR